MARRFNTKEFKGNNTNVLLILLIKNDYKLKSTDCPLCIAIADCISKWRWEDISLGINSKARLLLETRTVARVYIYSLNGYNIMM